MQAMGEAQQAYQQRLDEDLKNPFAATDSNRVVPKGLLFNKQIHRSDLKALEIIGSGQFGAVYLATQLMRACPITGKLFAIDGHLKKFTEGVSAKTGKQPPAGWTVATAKKQPVVRAVKMLKGAATPEAKEEFMKEAETMLHFDHDNVTTIQGVAVQQAPWLYVLEYCLYGDLRQVLLSCKARRFKVKQLELLYLCEGLAKGMEHVVSKGYIHMDMAARNLLLADKNIVKVADFGLTRKLPESGEKKLIVTEKNIKMAIKWLAPECLLRREFSAATDLWASAIAMWEIFSFGETPYTGITNGDAQALIKKGKGPACPKTCSTEIYDAVVTPCLAHRAQDRPTFTRLVGTIEKVMNKLRKADKGPEPGVVREIGKLLNDPEVEKQMKEDNRKREEERKKQAAAAAQKRANLIFVSQNEQKLWFHPDMPKSYMKKTIAQAKQGNFLVIQESPEKLLLCVHEYGSVQIYLIKVETGAPGSPTGPRPRKGSKGKKSDMTDAVQTYSFGGKKHIQLAQIIGNLRFSPFKGASGKPIKLTHVAKLLDKEPPVGKTSTLSRKKKEAAAAASALAEGPPVDQARSNPLFQDGDSDNANSDGEAEGEGDESFGDGGDADFD